MRAVRDRTVHSHPLLQVLTMRAFRAAVSSSNGAPLTSSTPESEFRPSWSASSVRAPWRQGPVNRLHVFETSPETFSKL